MLPAALIDTYQQYKQDTQKTLRWLVESAQKCGYHAPESLNGADKAPRLKGRARKVAKEAASSDTAPKAAKRVVRVQALVPMVKAIASSEKPCRISTGLIKLFRRCLRARTSTNEWYRENVADVAGDDNHEHFINVLQETLETLIPAHELQQLEERDFKLREQPRDVVSQERSAEPVIISVTNSFGHLEIEELDDAAVEALPDAPRAATVKASPETEYEVDGDDGEFSWEIHRLYLDMHKILSYVNNDLAALS